MTILLTIPIPEAAAPRVVAAMAHLLNEPVPADGDVQFALAEKAVLRMLRQLTYAFEEERARQAAEARRHDPADALYDPRDPL